MDLLLESISSTYSKIPERDDEPCNLFRIENRAIVMAYFSVGVVGSLIATPLNIYLVEVLNAEPEMQSTIGILMTIPWSLKLLFGFLSDVCPIYGLRRKPYLTIGSLVYSAAFLLYALLGKDSLVLLAVCVFVGTLGLIQIDVMADTMCVERSRFEPEESRGQMQATLYSTRFGGSLVGAVIGTIVSNKSQWGWGLTFSQVALLNGLVPFLLVAPWLYSLRERYPLPVSLITAAAVEEEEANNRDRDMERDGESESHIRGNVIDENGLKSNHSDTLALTDTDGGGRNHNSNHRDLEGNEIYNGMHATTLPLSQKSQGYQESDRSDIQNVVLDSHTQKSESEHVKGTLNALNYTDNPMIRSDKDREMINGNINGNVNGGSDGTRGGGSGGGKYCTDNNDNNNRTYNNFISSTITNTNANNRNPDGNDIELRNGHFNQTAENQNSNSNNPNLNGVKRTPARRRDIPYPTATVTEQLQQIWLTVQLKAVWKPMAFVYMFNIFQIPNVAWQSYLQLSLNFAPWILGLTVILGTAMTFAGVLGYKYLFFKISWRSVYLWSISLITFFSVLQLLLIFQINRSVFHIGNYYFALGDDVISAYISGIQFLPICIMYMRLCPDGSEGSSYAMLTTFGNIALVCAVSLGNLMANIWDVSNEAMMDKEIDGLWKLSLLTSMLALVPLFFLWLLPRNAEEQMNLALSKERSKIGGSVFLLVLFGSLAWTISEAIVELASVWGK